MIFFSFGFRPFFLAAGIYAVLSVGAWALHLGLGAPLPGGGTAWHGHEMLYGFAAAALAGFLLTATPNWSGRPPLAGAPLIALSALWLAGRAVMWLPDGTLPLALIAVIDGAFLPALLATVLPALAGNPKRQGVFIAILLLLMAGNALYHLGELGLLDGTQRLGLSLDGFVVLLTVVGGRVVPSFTANALRQSGQGIEPRSHPLLEKGVILSTVLVVAFDAADLGIAAAAAAIVAAALHGARLAGWQGYRCSQPLVWILHAGYLWLPIGLAMKGLDGLDLIGAGDAATHALSTGAIGTMTLAVMTRAALGHTGRPLVAPPSVVAAYLFVLAAGVIRVATGLGVLSASWGHSGAAVAWVLGFGLFTLVYLPILTGPRVDR